MPVSGGAPFQGFQDLMRLRIRDVLLVSSLYDSYLFEEDGRLFEQIRNEYSGLNLSHSPELTRVSGAEEALAMAREERRFDLIITTLHIEGMHPLQFAQRARRAGVMIPIVLLAFDNRELAELVARHDTSVFDRIFVWQGDYRLVIAIIKHLEDRMNVGHDTRAAGVQSIILIEDSIRYYSSFLPLIYTEILKQSQQLISEGVNLAHRFLRMRARPKILLCTSYEEAWEAFQLYRDHVLGLISDIDFHRGGRPDPEAGLEFARNVKSQLSDVPILLHSNLPDNARKAAGLGVSFVVKDSPFLLNEVREFISRNFGFGDFVFRTPDGREVGRAADLKSLEEALLVVPEESIRYHGERNHFSNWLKARTEFWLAHRLRPRKVSDYESIARLREDLIASLRFYRRAQQRGIIADFSKEAFDRAGTLARIGGGSLGGKARGLGFLNVLISQYGLGDKFAGVRISVPSGVVVGTDAFDRFLDENNLREAAVASQDDARLTRAFLQAERFAPDVLDQLSAYLGIERAPLAVRSSSLLEDSQYQPFAGVYETYMLPNNDPDPAVRLRDLADAIRRVYASTFYLGAKNYIRMTSYRLEEEKMAVIIQRLAGSNHGERFYPNFSGVAKSYNFYPAAPQTPADGIVSVALGLGKMVVEGGPAVRFCPKYPAHLPQLSTIKDTLENNQHDFFALDLAAGAEESALTHDTRTRRFPLAVAEGDGTLAVVGSTYSQENDAVYDGISRAGMRLVTFAPILKNKLLPLADTLDMLLDKGSWGMGSPVEIEFAVDLCVPPGAPAELAVLQMRPLAASREFEDLALEKPPRDRILCESKEVLGNGVIGGLHDVVVVDRLAFDRSRSREVAEEVAQLNAKLVAEGRPYLLIGVGRWGTLDPWLGIPVQWEQIAGARAIVETGFRDFSVAPSQGSHFFHNLTSFMVGYFTVNEERGEGFLDWDWISSRKPVEAGRWTLHLRCDSPIEVRMNGHGRTGIITKPAAG